MSNGSPIRRVLAEVKYPGQRRRQQWIDPPTLMPHILGTAVINDPDPTLSADLKLNGHGIIGQLDDETLVIDGGLL